jgi:hypothetical protein
VEVSKLEWCIRSSGSPLVRRFGVQSFRDFLKCCQAYNRDLLRSSGVVKKGYRGSYETIDGRKYYPNTFYQDSALRVFLKEGCKTRKSALFFVNVIRFGYGIEFMADELLFNYVGMDDWDRMFKENGELCK